jgi:hypothetical protein
VCGHHSTFLKGSVNNSTGVSLDASSLVLTSFEKRGPQIIDMQVVGINTHRHSHEEENDVCYK